METVAYLRVSTGSQNLANQKLAILEHARQKHFAVDRFVEVQASSRQGPDQRRSDKLLDSLRAGDRLVVSELSRLGRSLGQVIQIVETLVRRKIRFIAIKEAIEFDGKEEEIRILLQKQVSKASIAKIVGVSRTAMHHFINSRKLDPKASQPRSPTHRP